MFDTGEWTVGWRGTVDAIVDGYFMHSRITMNTVVVFDYDLRSYIRCDRFLIMYGTVVGFH